MTPAPADPVRARRAQIARWTLLANRIGYLFVALSMILVMMRHRYNQRQFDSVALIGEDRH